MQTTNTKNYLIKRISLINGSHLTSTNKKHICAILNSKLYQKGANTLTANKIKYSFKDEGNGYINVRIESNYRDYSIYGNPLRKEIKHSAIMVS